ncbi:hypothetical protein M426DRAFT_75041 [Hypoxylon sp. CI-4A]|nr:hypothetical protein M426DRAFT_75041 [Hypoxylon sp. CI-4A]
MKKFLFLFLFFLTSPQPSLLNAYQIDGLNDAADQTIGFKCVKWNDKDKTCLAWQACKPKKNSSRDRCDFDELITAKKCYTRYTTVKGKNPKVSNFPPYTCMKNSNNNFNDHIKRTSDVVDNTYKNKATDVNHGLFESFDATLTQVSEARAGDHGPYLIKEAQTKLGGKMEIQIQDVGTGKNPATGERRDRRWIGKRQPAEPKLAAWLINKQAKEHYAVIMEYKQMADKR